MRILVLETNLMWTSRLRQSLSGLGHEPVVSASVPTEHFDAAIVNLGEEPLRAQVPQLVNAGVWVIAHAGHKEKQLHQIGKDLGCHRLATNSEITFKLEQLLNEVAGTKIEEGSS
ncbi:MAG TPA: hypothetical protein PKA27_06575 [Fimbriimonadaceae bacterium]|nr:hypothetical protein [Fimbriimonadaceae bacterium]